MDITIIKALCKSRTIWFAATIAVLSVLQGFVLNIPIGPAGQAIIGCLIAVAVTMLRMVTTQPLSEK